MNPEINTLQTRMIDVGDKETTQREAIAEGFISMQNATVAAVAGSTLPKGNAAEVARVAAILAAKNTPQIIPLCHPLQLSFVSCDFEFLPGDKTGKIRVQTHVRCAGKTGVEMEALAACTAALLTIYDMTKGVDEMLEISSIRLLEKRGGKSGDFFRAKSPS